jgi:hypothetical protein
MEARPRASSSAGPPAGSMKNMPDFYAEKLSDPTLGTAFAAAVTDAIDPKYRLQQASELRDTIDVLQGTDYPKFLAKLVPVFLKILGEGQPIFVSTLPEQVSLRALMLIV